MNFIFANWRWLLLAALIASNVLMFKLWRGSVQEFAEFKAQIVVLGEAAKKEAERINAENKAHKEKTDEAHKRTTAALRRDITRLRNTSGGNLPLPAATAGSPDRACFDRAELDQALRSLDQGLLGIVETGSQAVADLDAAKEWANPARRQ